LIFGAANVRAIVAVAAAIVVAACAPTHKPLSVLGVYSPSASGEAYERFIREEIDEHDPALHPEIGELLARFGRVPDYDRGLEEEELRAALGKAALVEILIDRPDERFDVHDFVHADPAVPQRLWQVAWQETYLSEDGERVLSGSPSRNRPPVDRFRIVFFIHNWKHGRALQSSYGDLPYGPLEPVPERLWRLVRYETVD
jgi:hypothetical protein